ncbi:hypothetical protein BME53_28665 [Klebsiella quasipneumoniae subsp. similipneumoniae]|nr:hypothetical protein BME61_28695 [Klebsiella quasipneumoniae subsp. similipneumoniae]ROG13302.1 hypothetical protein C4Y62_026140 [Klebsiella pneumoniae subsp. pneumoniae]HBX5202121.1 hypothetical protein [Klebsiella pneumoniae]OVW11962.1 hypothetical protein BME58_25790 [Klebsiella quasipneumoniae subsp. similipneumoniae]OVW16802.1 hypothetical protein BME56_28635 [Klebsiella quasipneumoniae subsp. similipneumoniae]
MFFIFLREKRERQRRQETNRTAVRSVPITQAGDRGEMPGFWQILNARLITRRIILVQRPLRGLSETDNPVKPGWECPAGCSRLNKYGGRLVQRGIFGNQPAGKVKRKPGSSTVSFETLITLYMILS